MSFETGCCSYPEPSEISVQENRGDLCSTTVCKKSSIFSVLMHSGTSRRALWARSRVSNDFQEIFGKNDWCFYTLEENSWRVEARERDFRGQNLVFIHSNYLKLLNTLKSSLTYVSLLLEKSIRLIVGIAKTLGFKLSNPFLLWKAYGKTIAYKWMKVLVLV